jgi:hypothetical protein
MHRACYLFYKSFLSNFATLYLRVKKVFNTLCIVRKGNIN